MTDVRSQLSGDDRLIRSLLDHDPLPAQAVIDLMRLARAVDADYAGVAESLVPGSAEFLREEHAAALACAEITKDQARREIAAQKKFFKRLAVLVPGLLKYFKFDYPSDAIHALSRIDDCHRDFSIIARSQRRDKARRLALEALSTAQRATNKAATALLRVDALTSLDYERLRSAYLGENRAQRFNFHATADMAHELEICSAVIELCALRANKENDYLIISTSGTSTYIVETAFELSVWHKGPPLVTTPGSDFSAVCSIIHEIVSGLSDESLAGTINRFTRSEAKQRILAEEEQLRVDNDEALVPDNFRAVASDIAHASEDIEIYNQLADTPGVSITARRMAQSMVSDAQARLETARKKYGPNLLWAHQIPDERLEGMKTAHHALKQAAILLGELRREVEGLG